MRNYIETFPNIAPIKSNQLENIPVTFIEAGMFMRISREQDSGNISLIVSEIPKNPERVDQIDAVSKSVLLWGKRELRVNLAARIPTIGQIHFYSRSDYQKITKICGLNPNSVASFWPENGNIFVMEDPNPTNTLARLQHEILHRISFIAKCKRKDATQIQSGYHNLASKTLGTFDEALTEMANIHIVMKYWGEQPELLSQLKRRNLTKVGYQGEIIVVDELIKRIADIKHQKYEDVFRRLQKGKVKGKIKTIQILAEVLDDEEMKIINEWAPFEECLPRVVKALKVGRIKVKFDQYERGIGINILERMTPGVYIWH